MEYSKEELKRLSKEKLSVLYEKLKKDRIRHALVLAKLDQQIAEETDCINQLKRKIQLEKKGIYDTE